MPAAVFQMDSAVQEHFFKLGMQNKIYAEKINILEDSMDILLNWHNGELKRLRTDNKGEKHFMERLIYGSKKDVDIIKLPRLQ